MLIFNVPDTQFDCDDEHDMLHGLIKVLLHLRHWNFVKIRQLSGVLE
jgi:hypothetical protein